MSATTPKISGKSGSVAVADLAPNPWNYNGMSASMFAAAKQSIIDNGFCVEIQVRAVGPDNPDGHGRYEEAGLEIIDGYHRWLAAQELGMKKVPIRNLGILSDLEAERRTVQFNLKGDEPNDLKLSQSVKRLKFLYDDAEDLGRHTGLSTLEVEALLSLTDGDWPEVNAPNDSGSSSGNPEKASSAVSITVTKEEQKRWRSCLRNRDKLETDDAIKSNTRAVFLAALDLLEKEIEHGS